MNEKTLKVLEYNKIIEILVEKAESQLGKNKIREIEPLIDIEKIEVLQKETAEALSLLIKRGNPPLYGIHSISNELKRLDIGGSISPGGLIKISDSLRVSRSLKNFIRETKDDKISNYEIIENLVEGLSVFKDIEDEINNAIINENEISDSASSALRNIRRQIMNKNDAVKDKLNSIIGSQSNKKYSQGCLVNIFY